jgi:hypothetical protein
MGVKNKGKYVKSYKRFENKQANSKKKSVRNRQKPTIKVETSCSQVKKKKKLYLKGFKNSF